MKWIILILTGMMVIQIASAISITLPDGELIDYYSDVPINVTSSFGTIKVYVGNGTSYTEDENLICEFASSGSYLCGFTAYKGNSDAFDNCESYYKFGDEVAVGVDSGTDPKNCTATRGAKNTYNQGMFGYTLNGTGLSTDPALSCGDVRDVLLGASADWTIMAWAKFAPLNSETGAHIFWKNDDRPNVGIQPQWNRTRAAIWYTTVSPPQSMTGPVNELNQSLWNHITFTHDSSDFGILYHNLEESVQRQLYTSFSPGSAEYIGAESADVSPNRNLNGYTDELLMCSGIYTEENLTRMYTFKTGEYCIKVNDSNADSAETCFTKDIDNPVLNIISPGRNSGIEVSIEVNVTDFTNVSLNVTLDGSLVFSVDKNATQQSYVNSTTLTVGTHTLSTISCDLVNKCSTDEQIFLINNIIEERYFNDGGGTIDFRGFANGVYDWIKRFFI